MPGGVYHVASRGVRRDRIFSDDLDCAGLLAVLAGVVERFGWRCHGYCLMTNHYHLVIEIPEQNLSRGMQRLNTTYARRFNTRHGFTGHAFGSRFYSGAVRSDSHLLQLLRYVVLNPVRAGLVPHPAEWVWSSYRSFAGHTPLPAFLAADYLLAYFGRSTEAAFGGFRAFVADGIAQSAT